MAAGSLAGFFERWKSDWIDPALDYIEGAPRRSDSHLNDVSIEYSGEDVRSATRNFDPSCMLGSGTFGSVYKGTMIDGTEVAIKVLQVPEEAGFEDEVKVLSRFRHPNLVILMGFARHLETGGRSLIYEYLSGGDVSRRLQKSRQHSEPFEWRARLSAALDASCGLSHLHNMTPRAFHRDIKGPNILLDKNGTAKMADFGLSCVSADAQHKVRQASGTIGYACPEYIRSGIITEGSEVHSFGMVLLELLTGAPPAVQRPDKPHEFCYLVDHLQGRVAKAIQMLDPTSHFPLALAQSVTETAFRCIQQRPEERPLFKQLVEELRQLLHAADAHAERPNDRPPGSLGHQPSAGGHGRQGGQQAPGAMPPGIKRLMAGSSVECRWRGGTGWFPGRIAKVNPNGTFAIKYSDGDFEDQVPVHYVRAADGSPGNSPARGGGPPASAPHRGGQQLQQQQQGPARARDAVADRQAGQRGPLQPQLPQQQGQGRAVVSPERKDRHRLSHKASPDASSEGEQVVSARLWCVYAQGVELGQLTAQQRSLPFPTRGQELIVGRTAQAVAFWDTLVPDRRLHGTVSREHFKVVARRSHGEAGESGQVAFFLVCMSLNGCLLNSKYLGQGGSERPLQHGDVIALAASTEPAASQKNEAAPTRKSFVVFAFETQSSSRAVPDAVAPPPAPPPPPLVPTEGDEVLRPPPGTVAGRWRTSEAVTGVPSDALFCLEVHGEHVRPDLSAEARQLFFCCDASAATLPTLRIGRHYQRGFWQRAIHPPFLASVGWAATVAVDHFDIRALRRSNPLLNERPDWRFRLRVVGPAGVTLNYDAVRCAGEEVELGPSDTLTLGASSPAVSSAAGVGALPGLHLTFIPLAGNLDAPGSPLGAGLEVARQLPALTADDDGEARVDGSAARPVASALLNSAPQRAAGSLRPPPFFEAQPAAVADAASESPSPEGAHKDADRDASPDEAAAGPQERHPQPMKTRVLPPIDLADEDNVDAPDDLFSRTGFVPKAGESSVEPPEEAEAARSPPEQPRAQLLHGLEPEDRAVRQGARLSKFTC